jgi:hypothetical protein
MDDEQEAGSGSRWESQSPRPDDERTELETAESTPSATEKPGGRRDWMRSRGAITGAGVGLAAIIGLGGFAIGHATADGDGGHREGQGFHRFEGDRGGEGHGRGPRTGLGDRPEAPQQAPSTSPLPSPSSGAGSSSNNG